MTREEMMNVYFSEMNLAPRVINEPTQRLASPASLLVRRDNKGLDEVLHNVYHSSNVMRKQNYDEVWKLYLVYWEDTENFICKHPTIDKIGVW